MKFLAITLGHNSSAVFYDGNTLLGYEEERLSKIKSDSSFPKLAIKEIQKHVDISNSLVLVSHWFNTYDTGFLKLRNLKYVDVEFIEYLESLECKFESMSEHFSHHFAHAYSVLNFWLTHKSFDENVVYHIIVADGFGNFGEVTTVYEYKNNVVYEIFKVRGYEKSCGLLYQYATSFLGMKENQDEYKLLGYEAHIDKFQTEIISMIYSEATTFNPGLLVELDEHSLIDRNYLEKTKDYFYITFNALLTKLDLADNSIEDKRVLIAFFVQTYIEKYFSDLVKDFNIQNLLLAGGVFYNVKLNNCLSKLVDKICVNPLAGDQGCGFGMIAKYEIFKHKQLIGKRDWFTPLDATLHETVKEVANLILEGCIINIIGEYMEFGPRALCSTSTIFLPTKYLVDKNNKMNGRNEIMPCAPVVLPECYPKLFPTSKCQIVGSLQYMVIAQDYYYTEALKILGAAHIDPINKKLYTGRPQLISSPSFIHSLLHYLFTQHGILCLVNTSFNTHGTPIIFDEHDIDKAETTYEEKGNRVYTFYIKEPSC
jgi:carbamoyltransferase